MYFDVVGHVSAERLRLRPRDDLQLDWSCLVFDALEDSELLLSLLTGRMRLILRRGETSIEGSGLATQSEIETLLNLYCGVKNDVQTEVQTRVS